MSAVETLTARHQEADAQPQGPGLSIMPSLRTMIIGCVDPRVDPVFVLGLNPGEAAVLRNVGGRVTPGAVREMAMLQEVARAHGARPGGGFDLIVLHHTDCGITSLESQPEQLAGYFGVEAAALPSKSVSDPRAAVAVDVALLRSNPRLPRDWVVSGLVYDVHTGRVEVVVPPEPSAP
ncbi:carbonic anhydrase (plasmid) [Deinococcus aetherius]|uniref:Carbonic anhydrase n=1 Tax=Deinococcus aetherius TaxID=200252 RepID=A0ABN6RJV0_9DEIO|nr:carbonic anhydrase [Deinococcus aetherius]BDP43615.1 carbonic anhydrase [Deinococcus aetherius]